MSRCSCSWNQLTRLTKERIIQQIIVFVLLHLGPWCVHVMTIRKIFFQFVWSQNILCCCCCCVLLCVNTFAKLMEKWNWPFFLPKKSNGHHTFPPPAGHMINCLLRRSEAKSFRNLVRICKLIVPSLITLTLIRLVVSRFHLDSERAYFDRFFGFSHFWIFPKLPFRA
jgi:hypothetical protein